MTKATKVMAVSIDRDGVWAGTGEWNDGEGIVDCPAVLGDNQDESDETYSLLTEAIEEEIERLGGDKAGVSVTVERPDGTYTAELVGD